MSRHDRGALSIENGNIRNNRICTCRSGIGIVVGRYLLRSLLKSQEIAAQSKVKKILKDAETNAEILKKDRLLEAKEKFLQLKSEHEQEVNAKNNQMNQRENALKQKEQSLIND